ncbi:MAG: DUF4349 domain-containing protein [Armatimonadetes bacterium]|nr:DUF4349 domain-containing protein [Armatimonadota bacterium]
MTRRPNDTLTPLEETLTNLPQEEAPADLEDRCLAALDAAQAAGPAPLEGPYIIRPKRPVPWNHFAIAAAASLLIALVAMPLLTQVREKAPGRTFDLYQSYDASGPSGPMATTRNSRAASAPAPAVPSQEPPEVTLGRPHASYQSALDKDRAKTEAEEAPAPPPGGPGAPRIVATTVNEGYGGSFGRDSAGAKRAPRQEVGQVAGRKVRDATAPPPSVVEAYGGSRLAQTVPAPGMPEAPSATDAVVPAPSQPWYDRTDERKKISTRDMTIETPNVEAVYQQAVSAIEKVGGYIAHEDLVMQDEEPDRATIAARVPAASFDAVVQQLRGLGKLVKLTGSSEDRTQEYQSRATDIRALSDAEQQMVRRYDNASAEQKRVLRAALDELRRSREKEKQALLKLAAETSYAYLDIAIVEDGHFWHNLRDKCAAALPFAMALALVALPFFVVAMVWRRRG